MLLKAAPKNTNALQRVIGIILILGSIAILFKTTHGLTRYPSWNNTITLTVAAVMLFIGTALTVQTIRRGAQKVMASQPRKSRPPNKAHPGK